MVQLKIAMPPAPPAPAPLRAATDVGRSPVECWETNWHRRARIKENKKSCTSSPAPARARGGNGCFLTSSMSQWMTHVRDEPRPGFPIGRPDAKSRHWLWRRREVMSARDRAVVRVCEIARSSDRLAPERTRCGVTAQVSRLPVRRTGNRLSFPGRGSPTGAKT